MTCAKIRLAVLVWLTLSLGGSLCRAQNVIVRIWRSGTTGCECGGSGEPLCYIEEVHSAGSDFDIDVFPCVSHVNIYSGPGTIKIDGNIGSPSIATKITASSYIESMEAEAIWADIEVESATGVLGNIWDIDTRSGDINGSIHAFRLNKSGGAVDPTSPFEIAGDWNADVTLGADIRAPIEIGGDLSAGSVWTVADALLTQDGGSDPLIGRIEVSGDLLGMLSFGGSVRGPITVAGDLGANAVIDIGARIETETTNNYKGSLTINGRLLGAVNIGRELQGPIWVRNLDNSGGIKGLVGQIVINALDDGYGWDDLVSLGDDGAGTPAPLLNIHDAATQPDLAPYYERLSTDIGGGAIGLVPFNFHPKDSAPDHGSTVTTGAPTSVQIHHYGPVSDIDDDTSLTPPVKVYEASIYLPIGYGPHSTIPVCDTDICDDVTSGFDFSVSGRVVTVTNDTHSFASSHVYEFIPADLRCDDVPGTPDVLYVSDWAGTDSCGGTDTDGYGFRVFGGIGMFDLNENQSIEAGDVATWITSPVDFDADSDADVVDLAALVGAVSAGE